MKIKLLSFDSMGTRSICTLIEAKCGRILIDPGAALGPRRYGLKPHPLEREQLSLHKRMIEEEAREADLIIITHYHYDHFPRPREDVSWLRKKRILVKDPVNRINFSQRIRAKIFLDKLGKLDARVEIADSREIRLEGCRIRFSHPVEHGNDSRLGYVLETMIEDRGEKLVHSSDVEGFPSQSQLKFVLRNRPDVLICDGPMTYMLGSAFTDDDLKKSIKNFEEMFRRRFLSELIVDHHLLRDLEWRKKVEPLLDSADEFGVKIFNAASYMGLRESLLEARRKELYEKFGETPRENIGKHL